MYRASASQGCFRALVVEKYLSGHFNKNIFRRAGQGFLMCSAKAFECSGLKQTVAHSHTLLIRWTMNWGRQRKFNHMNLWDRKAVKLSFVKFIPTNGGDSSNHYLIQAEIDH